MAGRLKILFVEDVVVDAELIWREIDKNKIFYVKELVDNEKDYLVFLKDFEPDLIISDFKLPRFDGMTALLLRKEHAPLVPFILVTGSVNEEIAVECMKAGADDYILKDNLSRLGPAILNSIKKSKLSREKLVAKEELQRSEMRLQKAQAIAHVGNWELDLSRKTMWGSDEALRIYGLNQDSHEIPYEIAKKVPLPEYRPMLDEALDRLLKYNEPYDIEFKIKRENDGAIRSVYSKAELVFEFDGEQVKVIGVIQDTTDRKKVENALKESEKKYYSIFENIQDVFYETSMDGTILEVSPSIVIVSKGIYRREDLIGRSIIEFYTDEEIRKSILEELKEHGSVNDFEIILGNFDEVFIYCSISAKVSFDVLGQPVKIIGSMRDITERKKVEEAIDRERRMLRTLIDNLPDPIYVQDKECRKVIANKADVENIGAEKESEVLGKSDIELFPGKIGKRGYADDLKVINTGKPIINLEEEFVSAKGVKRWLQTTKIPLLDKDGNITGLVGIGHDITERKRAEEELNQSYAFNESLLRTIPFGMDIVDEAGNILFLSDTFKRIFGEGDVGEKCWELYRDDKRQCMECPLSKGIIIGETDVYESHGVLSGRTFEISHTGMMYRNQKAMLEIFQDISERKESEAELIRAKEKAEESDMLKTAFLHNISHEIRTPMTAIVGFSALFGEPDIDEKARTSYIEVIMQSSNHLLSIITDIVDISNIEANLIKTAKNEININSVLKSLYNQFIPKADEKKIELSFESGLSDSDAIILTDNTKLTQILTNLVSNALKFTDKGQVRIWYSLKDKYLEFGVSDTGIGISNEHHNRVFDRFYQIQSGITRLYEGTGLGLAISKAYVEHLGGKIWLLSEPGVGTTFFFTIPFKKRESRGILENIKVVPDSFVFPVKKIILVAEDVESNFKLIRYFLNGSNAEVLHAYNGKEAVEKCLSSQHIDLVLMDIKMPVMDGYTAVKLIREKNPSIPIIAQTAYADDKDKAFECGCTGFISKPFDKKGLFKVLCEFI